MAYNKNHVDVDHGELDHDSSDYFAGGFHVEQLGLTPRKRIQMHERSELIASLGIPA